MICASGSENDNRQQSENCKCWKYANPGKKDSAILFYNFPVIFKWLLNKAKQHTHILFTFVQLDPIIKTRKEPVPLGPVLRQLWNGGYFGWHTIYFFALVFFLIFLLLLHFN